MTNAQPAMSAVEFRNLQKRDRLEIGSRANDRALAMAGFIDRGPAPGLHGGTQCRLYEKNGEMYTIVKKVSRGSWIGFQPKFDRTGRLQAVRSLDEADKVCAATIDYHRDLIRVFLFDKDDVLQSYVEQFNKRRAIGKLPRGGIGMWFCLGSTNDNGRPLTEREAAGSGLAERYRPIAEFPIEAPSNAAPQTGAPTPAPAPTSGSGDLHIGDRLQLVPRQLLTVIDSDDRLYPGTPDEIVNAMYADAIFCHDTERTVETWMSAVLGRMGRPNAPVLSAEFFLGALAAVGDIEIFAPGSKIWPRPQERRFDHANRKQRQ